MVTRLAYQAAQQMFPGEPFSVVRPQQFDEETAMRSEFAGRHSPFRPWLGRIFVKPRGVPSGRADAVAANDHNIASYS
jgi:hypothetical protein